MNYLEKFLLEEYGASLVEYAVALIVVTIIGGAGVIAIGSDAGALAATAGGAVDAACDLAVANNGTGVDGDCAVN